MERFLASHRGPGVSELGEGALARAALHLFLAGRVDFAALRLERNLSEGSGDGARLLLLGLFSRLRAGHPQASATELATEIEQGFEAPLEKFPKGFDPSAHLADLAAAKGRLLAALRAALERIAAAPEVHGPLFGGGAGDPLPLVVVRDGIFSFARFHAAQTELAARLRERASAVDEIDPGRAERALAEIDALPGWPLHAAQREAVAAALRHPFLVLTGGPGTGKTAVVSRILLALSRCLPGFDPEAVALCAPTGRAKARLSESLGQNLSWLRSADPLAAGLAAAPAHTLHSLLGALPDGSFRHDARNPLPHRVVVLDEASMVDLPLFASFLSALAPGARLVVVGDPDQLPSVDAGAVLADLVANPSLRAFRAHLTHTHRNSGDIAEICRKVSRGEKLGDWLESRALGSEPVQTSLFDVSPSRRESGAGRVIHLGSSDLPAQLRSWLEERFGAAVRRAADAGFTDPSPLLEAVERARVLCAVHEGDAGAQTLNRIGDAWLRTVAGWSGSDRFLPGQQVILTRNHPSNDLWNGDLGVVAWRDRTLVAVFGKPGRLVALPVERLEGLESAWAITVHKSQGSEFDEILFALPDRDTPVLSRQILYTALSRARGTVRVHGDPHLLDKAVARSADRPGRLREEDFG